MYTIGQQSSWDRKYEKFKINVRRADEARMKLVNKCIT